MEHLDAVFVTVAIIGGMAGIFAVLALLSDLLGDYLIRKELKARSYHKRNHAKEINNER